MAVLKYLDVELCGIMDGTVCDISNITAVLVLNNFSTLEKKVKVRNSEMSGEQC